MTESDDEIGLHYKIELFSQLLFSIELYQKIVIPSIDRKSSLSIIFIYKVLRTRIAIVTALTANRGASFKPAPRLALSFSPFSLEVL
jgi:hypothetical protein